MSKFASGAEDVWFQRYMLLATSIGLILPLATVICASNEVAILAAPPLFVLWFQIIGESATLFNPNVHRFVALLLPIGFNVYRMNLLVEWCISSFELCQDHAVMKDFPIEYVCGLVLASINLLFWMYNLFAMLLLKVTPDFLADEKCESPKVLVGAPCKCKGRRVHSLPRSWRDIVSTKLASFVVFLASTKSA